MPSDKNAALIIHEVVVESLVRFQISLFKPTISSSGA